MVSYKKNIVFNIFSSFGPKAVTPLLAIFTARLLQPDDYGLFGLASALLALPIVIKDLGISNVIISKAHEDNLYRTQLYIQLTTAFITIILSFSLISVLDEYFSYDGLGFVIFVMSLTLFVSALEDSIVTFLRKTNNYKSIFISNTISSIAASALCLLFAWLGFGVYALVFSYIANRTLSLIFMLKYWKCLIGISTSTKSLDLISDGKHILSQRLASYFAVHSDSTLVGKYLSTSDLGIYRIAKQFGILISSIIGEQYKQVLFSESSNKKSNPDYVKLLYNRYIIINFLINLAIYIIFRSFSGVFIDKVLGEQWQGVNLIIPYISLMALSGYISAANGDFSVIFGFNKVYTYYSIFRTMILVFFMSMSVHYGILVMIKTVTIVTIFLNVINTFIFSINNSVFKISRWVYLLYLFVIFLYFELVSI
ncbi:oligosaccharide flippase family protein [Vibrio brasiliensis]